MTDAPDLSGFKPKDLPDLAGTKAVVTGANSGIGFHTAAALADHGAEVVLACRNTEAGRDAAKRMKGMVTVEELDLASQTSVHAFVDRFDGSLDLLVNNAGVMTPPKYRETAGGPRAPVRHQPPRPLRPHRPAAAGAAEVRDPAVVTVASIAHHRGDESVLEGNPESSYEPNKDVRQQQARQPALRPRAAPSRRRGRLGLVSAAAHPGVSATNLVGSPDGMGSNPIVRLTAPYFMPVVFQSSAAGANPTLWAATYGDPGSYVGPKWLRESRAGSARPS